MKKRLTSLFISILFTLIFFIPTVFSSARGQLQSTDSSHYLNMHGTENDVRDESKGKRLGNVITNPTTGLPEFMSGFKTEPMGNDGKMAAMEFIQRNFDFLKIDTSALSYIKEIAVGKTKHVKFQQMYKDIPIEGGEVLVHMTTEGEIVGLSSYYQPEPFLDVTPQITAEEALSTVLQDLGIDTTEDVSANTAIQPLDPDTSSQSGTCASYLLLGLEDPLKPVLVGPELVIYPDAEGKKRINLAWKIAYSGQNAGSWKYFIDAHTGEIISSQDVRIPLNFTTEGYYKAKYFPTDGDDDLSTSPLANSDVLTQYYYGYYRDYDDDTSSPTSGYYEVDYNYGYYWYRLFFLMNGPKCWVIDDRDGRDSYYYTYFYTDIPEEKDFTWNQNPYNSNSLFDSQNVCWHVNNSLYNFYSQDQGFSLGYKLKCYTHYNTGVYPCYYDQTSKQIKFSAGVAGYNNPTRARDVILHELQHAATHKIYEPNNIVNDIYELSLNEAFSDYFSCAQTEDADIGEWVFLNPNNVRHLDIQRNKSQFDIYDSHANGQIYGSALWDIRENRGFDADDIDELAFKHLYWEPRNFLAACNSFMGEAQIQGYTTPQIWTMNYVFARQGITHDFLWETFSDGLADGWQTMGGLWHISSYRSNGNPYSLAYNQQPPVPPDYDVGTTSGDAILEIENLDEFEYAELNFSHWYKTECYSHPCFWDRMTVSISTNGGSSWKSIFDSSDGNLWDPSWNDETWNEASYNFLPSELVSSILIRFSFNTIDSVLNDYEGWYIDNINVYTDGPMY